MRPVDVKWETYIDFFVESNIKKPTFKVGDNIKYKGIFSMVYKPNWNYKNLQLKKLKLQHHQHMR